MAGAPPNVQLWHISRGVVFASGKEVIYPRLFSSAFHSQVAIPSNGGEAILPPNGPTRTAGYDHESSSEGNPVDDAALGTPGETACPKTEPEGAEGETATTAEEADTAAEGASVGPPFTPLDFKMPEEAFREARLAEPGTPESFWTYGLYRGPGDDGAAGAKVKLHYCKSLHTTEQVLQQHFLHEKVLGFDLEWSPSATRNHGPRQNVSLVQIASQDRIALFHLSLYPKNDDLVAPSLKKMMEDPGVSKVGVSIRGDCTRLRKFLGIEPAGIFELSHLYKLVKYSTSGDLRLVNKRPVSLAAQVEEYLRLPLFKGSDVRSSDWTQPLQMAQVIYSASDAYAALQLYHTLDHLRQNLQPAPPLPHHLELNLPIRFADGVGISATDEGDAPEGEEDGRGGPGLSARYMRSLGESIRIEADGDDDEPILKDAPLPRKAAAPAPKDQRIVDAEDWLAQYRQSKKGPVRAAPSSLRSYRLWHCNEDLDPGAIASLLRQPPLQTATVVNYVLEAIRIEKLPFDPARLQSGVLSLLPADVRAKRYKALLKACQGTAAEATTQAVAGRGPEDI